MSEAIIRIRGLSKRYGDLHVLRDLDLDIELGEKVSIIGPSGSGKSTLLRLIMTLERPDAGFIEIDGDRIWESRNGSGWAPAGRDHVSRVRSKVGMVFQHFNLFPHMTAIKNVMLAPVHVLNLSKEEAKQRAEDLLELVGLADKKDALPAQLSGGQKQRVAIARALAMHPRIMLFDEITSALDPELVGEVLNVVRDIAHQRDMTMLVVTHEMRFAEKISDRVLFFEDGRIVEQGKPEVIFRCPEHDRTRRFLSAVLES